MTAITPPLTNALQQLGGGMVTGVAPDSLLIENLHSDDYHADTTALSCSQLKLLLESPADFQLALRQARKPTQAMEFGTLLHQLALQPENFSDEYVVYPGIADGRDKDYTAFLEKNLDRAVVDHREYTLALHLVDVLRDATYKGRRIGLFIDESKKEVSIYAVEAVTGIRLRIRPDIFHPDITFDLKSTYLPNIELFRRDAIDKHYDMQSFDYTYGRAIFEGDKIGKPFVFLGVQTEGAHSVYVAPAGATFLENGAKKFQRALSLYKACNDTGYWPNRSAEEEFEIEPWQQYKA